MNKIDIDEVNAALVLVEAGWPMRRVARLLKRDHEQLGHRMRQMHRERMLDRQMREA